MTLATAGFEKHVKMTRRAAFLIEVEQVVPRRELCALIDLFYPRSFRTNTSRRNYQYLRNNRSTSR